MAIPAAREPGPLVMWRRQGAEKAGQHLSAGDLGAILEHQQQVVAEGLLPGRGPLPPCFRSDRSCCGIDIEAQPHTHAAHTAVRAWARADRIPGKRVASI